MVSSAGGAKRRPGGGHNQRRTSSTRRGFPTDRGSKEKKRGIGSAKSRNDGEQNESSRWAH